MSENAEENNLIPEESIDKVLSDLEKREFEGISSRNSSKLRQYSVLFLFSFLSFLVLFFAAYFVRSDYQASFSYVETESVTLLSEADKSSNLISERTFELSTSSNFPKIDDYSSQSVLIFDLNSNQSIYEKNAGRQTYVASLTKIASTKVLYDSVDMEGETVISKRVADDINGSPLKFNAGDRLKNIDLIKSALIASNNQSVFAIRDPKETVREMNNLASALWLTQTSFSNPAGFDEGAESENYSSARDLVPLAKLFFRNKELKNIASTAKTDILEQNSHKKIRVNTTNDLIKLGTQYVIAGKTGTTPKAGQNLLLLVEKNNRQYLVILLNGKDRYEDAYKVLGRL